MTLAKVVEDVAQKENISPADLITQWSRSSAKSMQSILLSALRRPRPRYDGSCRIFDSSRRTTPQKLAKVKPNSAAVPILALFGAVHCLQLQSIHKNVQSQSNGGYTLQGFPVNRLRRGRIGPTGLVVNQRSIYLAFCYKRLDFLKKILELDNLTAPRDL